MKRKNKYKQKDFSNISTKKKIKKIVVYQTDIFTFENQLRNDL